MYCYEITTLDNWNDWYHYYYVTTIFPIRSIKQVLTSLIPDKARLVMEDTNDTPIQITHLPIFVYIYRKYFRRQRHFNKGFRVNWEKEKI